MNFVNKLVLFSFRQVPINRTIKPDMIASPVQLPIVTPDIQPPIDVPQPAFVQPRIPTLPSHQDHNTNLLIPSDPTPVLVAPLAQLTPAVNLLLTGATPITNLPEVSFQLPASAAPPTPSLATPEPVGPCDIQFMPTLTPSPYVPDAGPQIDATPSAIPLSVAPPSLTEFTQSNYVLNGPYINPNFSKVINLPVTPSPPPLLEADENVESSSDKLNASPANELESETSEPSIPLSHLITANQYPSLNKIPSANIAQSFAPMYVPQPQQPQSSEGEIYSDYMNNPYNLTLQVDESYNNVGGSETVVTTMATTSVPTVATPNMNVFQSVNYFGSANDATIPPGSEMLFGAP